MALSKNEFKNKKLYSTNKENTCIEKIDALQYYNQEYLSLFPLL